MRDVDDRSALGAEAVVFREFMETSVEAIDSRYVVLSLILLSAYKVVNSETRSAPVNGSAERPTCYTNRV